MASFDIGVVPLDDSAFERAKFPFKLLQYLALGVPSVSARVGTAVSLIRERDNGLLAGTSDEWCDQLEALIADRSLRQRLAAAGRETVEARVLARTGWAAAGQWSVQRRSVTQGKQTSASATPIAAR